MEKVWDAHVVRRAAAELERLAGGCHPTRPTHLGRVPAATNTAESGLDETGGAMPGHLDVNR